jgi:hypothetical protein
MLAYALGHLNLFFAQDTPLGQILPPLFALAI